MIKIDINEVHQRLLEIAYFFHEICSRNDIPYYMLGGTMLGAYRHKGFIPWDDDMDFGVPLEHYERMKEVMGKELPSHFKCTTFRNDIGNRCSYVKIMDSSTHIEDCTNRIPIENQLGVNIDVFPLVRCDKKSVAIKRLIIMRRITRLVYYEPIDCGLIKKCINRFCKVLFPINQHKMLDLIQNKVHKCYNSKGKFIGNILGAWGTKEIVDDSIMGKPTLYPFEGIKLYGVAQPELYLTELYGSEYMTPPPKDKLHLHINNVYKKE